ncbi:MAG: histidine--tRNA ligase [Eubacteriales bacterium]|nr:histidine--tRNA ligase [Eubacteriales bacterium]
MITQAPRGTKDWFGKDMAIRQIIEDTARRIASSFNFGQIITPAFEHTALFERGVGDATDIVQKEMYTFEDKGGRSISLKPEGTSPVIRAYLEHNMYAEPAPKKFFYFTPAFRYEKPASGRLRQHHQFGCELIGSASPLAELEVISVAYEFIKSIGLKDVKLNINSIGQGSCRSVYSAALVDYLKNHEAALCPTCIERMSRNPLRVIDCKEQKCSEVVASAPRILDYLDDECKEHMATLEALLKANGIPYAVNPDIVRGLDYYTKTVFEFVDRDGFTLCGGGRFDGLVHEIDGKQDIPAVGFGMGIERIMYFLDKDGIELPVDTEPDLYLGVIGNTSADAYQLAMAARRGGLRTEIDLMGRSVRAQMKYANKIGAKFTAIIGEDECANRTVRLKNMLTGEDIICGFDILCETITKGAAGDE